MEPTTTPLSNSALALKDYCDRYDKLMEEKQGHIDFRKGLFAELKGKNLPVAAIRSLMKLEQKDQEDLKTSRDDMKNAGELLGVTVYVEAAPIKTDDPYAKDTIQFARDKVAAISSCEAELEEVKEDVKALLAEVKSTGFVPKLIPTICDIRRDPPAYKESNLLLNTYLTAIGVSNAD
jgi:uncharacterized protein (UPF0335 family)